MKILAINGGTPVSEKMIQPANVHLSQKDISGVVEVLKSGSLRQGDRCRELEKAFADKVGAGYTTTVANGTAALHAAYTALVEPGTEILVPSVTFFATAAMVAWAGCKPVFCDIDPRTLNINVEDAASRITSSTSAIVGVHLFGNACDIDSVAALAENNDLKVIYDAAQAHLTEYKGRDIGSFGDAVTYSFYATKNMTTGEGGMVASPYKAVIDKIILMKQQGQSGKYRHTMLGTNYRMTDVEAAIGLGQLRQLDANTTRRREIAARYDAAFLHDEALSTPVITPGAKHSYHQYTMLLNPDMLSCDRDRFVKRLQAENIGASINYPAPLHVQEAFKEISDMVTLPAAESFCTRCFSIPVHPYLSDEDVCMVIDGVKKVLEHSLR